MSDPIRTVAELEAALAIPCPSFLELWVELDDGQLIAALVNRDRGWLMHLRYAGDSGFSSRNPDYRGDPNELIDYKLSNGQLDQYPASWAYPVADLKRALRFFIETRRPPDWIEWHED
jgi:hypothetical protein